MSSFFYLETMVSSSKFWVTLILLPSLPFNVVRRITGKKKKKWMKLNKEDNNKYEK